ncbi:PHP domain-like protein [Backusella circina FSU 941]|nr:PHP domain-like protein [Backusella circina FSU 941]
MFYDLNIPYPNTPDKADFSRIEKIFDRIESIQRKATIALNLNVFGGLKDIKKIPAILPDKYKEFQQLTRVTLTIENAKSNYQVSSSTPYPSIDILAVRPTTVDVCKHACQTLEIDLISIDLAESRTAPNYVSAQVAVNRGIFFEICYSQSFRVPDKKAAFFSAVKRLVDVTRGHNLIFSSEAIRALDIRRPADLKILGSMFGMTQSQIEASMSGNYVRLLKKAETRRATYNAVVRIPETEKTEDGMNVDNPSLKRKEQPNNNNNNNTNKKKNKNKKQKR